MDKMDFFAAAAESALFAGSKAFVFLQTKSTFPANFRIFPEKSFAFNAEIREAKR